MLKGLLIGLILISSNLKAQDLYDLVNVTSIELTFIL
jgi:hypothetical protein